MLGSYSQTQSPSAWLVNLAGRTIKAQPVRYWLRLALGDEGYRFRLHPSEEAAGIVEADITWGFDVGDFYRYGATGDGVVDDTAAVQMALDALEDVGGEAGRNSIGDFRLTDTIIVPECVALTCAGRVDGSSTQTGTRFLIDHDTGNAFDLAGARTEVSNATIEYLVTPTTGSAIFAENQRKPRISRLYILGAYNGVTFRACNTPLYDDIEVANCKGAYGYLVEGDDVLGNSDSHLGRNISSAFTVAAPAGYAAHKFGNRCNSGKLEAYRFVGGDYGVYCSGADDPDDLWFTDGGCDNQAISGFYFDGAQSIFLNNPWCGQAEGVGVRLTANFTGNFVAEGLRIRGSGEHGMQISGGRNIHLLGPMIGQNSTDTDNTYDGIHIDAAVTRLNVVGGTLGALAAGGTNHQRYGINFNHASIDYVSLVGVNLEGNETGPLASIMTESRQQRISACSGYKEITEYITHTISGAVANGTYDIMLLPHGKLRITDIARKLSAGTCDVRMSIDGTLVGTAAVGATTTAQNAALSVPFTADASGGPKKIEVAVSNVASSPTDLVVTFSATRIISTSPGL